MKTLLMTIALVVTGYCGDLRQHVQSVNIDAWIDSSVNAQPDIPGISGKSDNIVSVSLTTTDDLAAVFTVYVRVKLDSGNEFARRIVVERVFGAPTIVQFSTGASKPVNVESFYVIRLRRQPDLDHLIP